MALPFFSLSPFICGSNSMAILFSKLLDREGQTYMSMAMDIGVKEYTINSEKNPCSSTTNAGPGQPA